jgi:hypothetical protein
MVINQNVKESKQSRKTQIFSLDDLVGGRSMIEMENAGGNC